MPTQVSVIICAYTEQRWDEVRAAIRSVHRQSTPPCEVILVIDHCPTLFAQARDACEGVLLLENTGQRGLSDARNAGLAEATGEVVAFLDDDAVADPEWVANLVSAYGSEHVVGVGGWVEPDWLSPRPSWFAPEFDWVVGCSYAGMADQRGPVRNFIGTNMSFRRHELIESGGFRTDLGRMGGNAAGCEETELCIRLAGRSEAAVLIHEPTALVAHRVPPTRSTLRYFVRRCFGEGRSKAAVARITGHISALETERRYVRSVIPRAIARSLRPRRAAPHFGIGMALALVMGLTATTVGYGFGWGSPKGSAARTSAGTWRRAKVGLRSLLRGPTVPGYVTLGAIGALWAGALTGGVQLQRMTNLGLLTVLPIAFWVSLGALMVSFCWWVRSRRFSQPLMAAHVVLLIAILHVTPVVLYGTLRYAWAWRHVGIVAFILQHGGVNLHVTQETVYQDWPGFFSFNALLTSASGLGSALSYASWGPPVFELLYLGPLLLIFRTLTNEVRLQWTALWVFYLGNWIGQDYFSPQAFTYFLYLVVIAVCLRWFLRTPRIDTAGAITDRVRREDTETLLGRDRTPRRILSALWVRAGVWRFWRPSSPDEAGDVGSFSGHPARRRAAYVLTLPMLFAVACTHQLTPFILLVALAVLVAAGYLRYRSLPLVLVGFIVGWIAIATRTFLNQNLSWIIQSIGHPLGNATASLATTSQADPSEVLIAKVDQLATVVVVLLALYSIWRLRKTRRIAQLQIPILLMCVPLVALVATSYGDEIRLRVFLFALPFLSLFAAVAIAPLTGRHRSGTAGGNAYRLGWAALARGVVICLLAVGFVYPYYGKEQTNYFSPQEVAVMKQLYGAAPAGSLIIGPNNNLPWSFAHYSAYQYQWFGASTLATTNAVDRSPVAYLSHAMGEYPAAYLVFSRSQQAADAFNGMMPRGALARVQADVQHSPQFRVWLARPDITVYRLEHGTRS